jgi:signal peptidase I
MGSDARPVRNAYLANRAALFSIILLGISITIMISLFGAGYNFMAPNSAVVLRTLWERGLVLILGDYLRYKLIKNSNHVNQTGIIISLTLTLAYIQMDDVNSLIHGDGVTADAVFEFYFKPVVISSMASCFALKGSFVSVISLNFVHTMITNLLPVLPRVSALVMTLTISGLVAATTVIFFILAGDTGRFMRLREKRAVRYAKKPLFRYVAWITILAVSISFFAGAFSIYPVVVLTGSMSGAIERGSIAFAHKVPPGKAFDRVGEGEVIHFTGRNSGLEYIHRVVGFSFDADGEREYITKGDASELADPFPVAAEDVLGTVHAVLPFLGWPYVFYRTIVLKLIV